MRIARIICIVFLAIGCSLTIPAQSRAQIAVGVSVRIGPPALPVYVQPVCPDPDYIWTPGYWAYDYDDEDYYWVPGTWVLAPEPGLLWTPGYWGWNDGYYAWHAGYWGPVVGFYGGINYGFGYTGAGFYGGYWRGGSYYYNRSVTNVNVNVVHNTYNTTVVNNYTTVNRVSFNGGPGGVSAQPTREEFRAERERHVSMTPEQTQQIQIARNERTLRASVNHGRPDIAASPRAGEFHGRGPVENGRVEHANRPPDNRAENRPESSRPGGLSDNGRSFPDRPGRSADNGGRGSSDRPPFARSSNGASSDTRLDQKHQRELDKVQRQQGFERQKMQQRHDQEQQKLSRQNANQQRQDQLQRRQQQERPESNRPGGLSDNGRSFPDRPGRSADNSARGFSDRPRSARSSDGGSWNPRPEQKHQQELDRMRQQQDAERQRMQQRYDQEQQRMSRQNADQHREDQLQRRQQQQIEQMNRKHDQQSQRLEERQQRETQKQENRRPNNNRPDRQQR